MTLSCFCSSIGLPAACLPLAGARAFCKCGREHQVLRSAEHCATHVAQCADDCKAVVAGLAPTKGGASQCLGCSAAEPGKADHPAHNVPVLGVLGLARCHIKARG